MTGTASKDSRGNYCGRAVHGVSNLSGEDLRQIEALRARERPVPWCHLARQYNVCEADLRQYFEGATVSSPPPAPKVHVKSRGERLTEYWLGGMSYDDMSERLGMNRSAISDMRKRLGLRGRSVAA